MSEGLPSGPRDAGWGACRSSRWILAGLLLAANAGCYREQPGGAEPQWLVTGGAANGLFGGAVAIAGDLNGDGVDDLAVGASFQGGEHPLQGRVAVYFGSPAGPDRKSAWHAWGEERGCLFGSSVAAAGDVNRDGHGDLAVGAPGCGLVQLFHGSNAGPTHSSWTFRGDQAFDQFGAALASAGDVNGDGFDDLIVGAPAHDGAEIDEGRVYLFLGSPAGLGDAPDWTASGEQARAAFGAAVASAGDLDGDGYADIIVGAPGHGNGQDAEGRAYVFLGSPDGLSSSPDWFGEIDQGGAFFGSAVAGAGDVDGDGHDDMIIGAFACQRPSERIGCVYLYLGGPEGPAREPAQRLVGPGGQAEFGRALSGVGDWDGDGLAEIAVGAPIAGRVFIYSGARGGLEEKPLAIIAGAQAGAMLGASVAGGGDVDGDGCPDLVLGAPRWHGAWPDEGSAGLHLDRCVRLDMAPASGPKR